MAGGLTSAALSSAAPTIVAADNAKIKAIAFDAFPVFDPRPIGALAEDVFPGKGLLLMQAWRTRQFEYQWLRALGGKFADFMKTTEDALVYATAQLKLELTAVKKEKLMSAWSGLTAWPDALTALTSLKDAGFRLAFLSNMTEPMLKSGIKNAELGGIFEHVISTGRNRSFKPETRAYKLGTDVLKLKKEEVLFAAFAGWDVAGAKWFGYPTFWVNRADSRAEELGVSANATGKDLTDLTKFLMASKGL
jgi:2-haloacid dehalogenase